MNYRQKFRTFRKLLIAYLLIPYPIKKKFGIFLVGFGRGSDLANTFMNLIIILGIGAVVSGLKLNLSGYQLAIVGGIGVWIFYTIGFLDINFGFFKSQLEYATSLNPYFEQRFDKIEELLTNNKK